MADSKAKVARQVSIRNAEAPHETPRSFTFDAVYDENAQQKAFYEESCFSLVENVLEGFNGTIFAYGQTGCGKSWTMQGPLSSPPELRGVIPNSFTHIFDSINASKNVEFLVRCSYLEIYNEEIRDLLCDPKSRSKCDLREDPQKGVFVNNLTDVVVENEKELQTMLDKGLSYRTTASTLMNTESSRSHSIFAVVVEMSTKDDEGKEHIRAGKLNLVDLAGSERQKKTGATGATLKEGTKINLSLSALGNVISALSENKGKHIPYRDSKLTRLLQDSLGGNTKTLMIAAISPADYNHEETLSTLRYANRAKNIQNKPKINEDPKDTLLREYKEEIERLKALLEEHMKGGGGGLGSLSAAMESMKTIISGQTPSSVSSKQHRSGPRVINGVNNIDVDDGGDGDERMTVSQPSEIEPQKISKKKILASVASEGAESANSGYDKSVNVGVVNEVKAQPKAKQKNEGMVIDTTKQTQQSQAEEASMALSDIQHGGDMDADAAHDEEESDSAALCAQSRDEIVTVKRKGNKKTNARSAEAKDPQDAPYPQSIVAELDAATEQLRATQQEVEKERRMRAELTETLLQLEAKLMKGIEPGETVIINSSGSASTSERPPQEINSQTAHMVANREGLILSEGKCGIPGAISNNGNVIFKSGKVTSEEDEERARKYRERKQKAKQKQKQREEELNRIKEEKMAMEDELEDLRRAATSWVPTTADEAPPGSRGEAQAIDDEYFEKKLVKLKKKYEKRMRLMREEAEDLREELYSTRMNMTEMLREQEKDLKLFEQICQAALPDRDYKRIIERSKWSEDDEEWILPFVKKKSFDFSQRQTPSNLSPVHSSSHAPAAMGSLNSRSSNYGGGYDAPSSTSSSSLPALPSSDLPKLVPSSASSFSSYTRSGTGGSGGGGMGGGMLPAVNFTGMTKVAGTQSSKPSSSSGGGNLRLPSPFHNGDSYEVLGALSDAEGGDRNGLPKITVSTQNSRSGTAERNVSAKCSGNNLPGVGNVIPILMLSSGLGVAREEAGIATFNKPKHRRKKKQKKTQKKKVDDSGVAVDEWGFAKDSRGLADDDNLDATYSDDDDFEQETSDRSNDNINGHEGYAAVHLGSVPSPGNSAPISSSGSMGEYGRVASGRNVTGGGVRLPPQASVSGSKGAGTQQGGGSFLPSLNNKGASPRFALPSI